MAKVGLLNWSGHGNLGDDAMAEELMRRLEAFGHSPINMGENIRLGDDCDWYVVGGGTLITRSGSFRDLIRKAGPHRCLLFSMGVAADWNGEESSLLQGVAGIWARDIYSWHRLRAHSVGAELSVDMLAGTPAPYIHPCDRKGIAANFMIADNTPHPCLRETVHQVMDELRDRGAQPDLLFALSMEEDVKTMGAGCVLFDNAENLVAELAKYETAIVTRLHAAVLAWAAGVPDIRPIVYDPKVQYFLERVAGLSKRNVRDILNADYNEMNAILCSTPRS